MAADFGDMGCYLYPRQLVCVRQQRVLDPTRWWPLAKQHPGKQVPRHLFCAWAAFTLLHLMVLGFKPVSQPKRLGGTSLKKRIHQILPDIVR
jgi:hypothetical protein